MNKSMSSILAIVMVLFSFAAVARNARTGISTNSDRSAVGNVRTVEKNVNLVNYRNYSIDHNDYSVHN